MLLSKSFTSTYQVSSSPASKRNAAYAVLKNYPSSGCSVSGVMKALAPASTVRSSFPQCTRSRCLRHLRGDLSTTHCHSRASALRYSFSSNVTLTHVTACTIASPTPNIWERARSTVWKFIFDEVSHGPLNITHNYCETTGAERGPSNVMLSLQRY